MLPDFNSTKKKLEISIFSVASLKAKEGPIISKVNRKMVFEGKKHSIIDSSGDFIEKSYEKVASEFSVTLDEVLERGIYIFVEKSFEASNEIADKTTEGLINEISNVTSKTGNEIDASGMLFTEAYLNGLKNMYVEFDEKGNPYLPTLFLHPETYKKVDNQLREHFKENQRNIIQYNKKLEDIIELKRKEWNDRQSNRKLVD